MAQRVADLLVDAGVRSLLNFAPRVLEVPPGVLLRYVDLSMELQVMSFYQARQLDDEADDRMPVIRSVGPHPGRPAADPGRRATGGPARPVPRCWWDAGARLTGVFPLLGRVVARHETFHRPSRPTL